MYVITQAFEILGSLCLRILFGEHITESYAPTLSKCRNEHSKFK
jgi:hypothetical protein